MSPLMRPRFVARFLALTLLTACAAAPPAAEPGAAPGAGPAHGSSDVITETELADPSLAGSTVLEAIARLRPRFLNRRGGGLTRDDRLQISLDGSNPIPASELSRVELGAIAEIRYLSTNDAGLRFGLKGNMGPVLLITLRR